MKQSPFLIEPEEKWIDEVAPVVVTKLNEMYLDENVRNIQIINSILNPQGGFPTFVILVKYQRKIKDETKGDGNEKI